MKNFTSQQLKFTIIALTVVLVMVSSLFLYLINPDIFKLFTVSNGFNTNIGNEEFYKRDLALLKNVPANFGDTSAFFVDLAQREGGVYAFEILKQATLPPNTDLHLLGHTIGNEMFKQEGLEGMKYCTPDFRNACSHTIVIGALLQDGPSVFDVVNDVCNRAPGGAGAYTMCFHGFGHGVLAYTEYDIPSAIKLCEKVGTAAYSYNEFHQCVGGIVMEMYSGVHDPEVWLPQKEKFLDVNDPLKICQSDYMPNEAKYFCYVYITPYIFDAVGADNSNPSPDLFPKAFSYCDTISEPKHRLVCYGGLGKEFVVLAQSRDVRIIDQMGEEELQKVIDWCETAGVEDGIIACITEAQSSLYWGGENDYNVSVRFCSLMPNDTYKQSCFNRMFDNVNYFENKIKTKENICSAMPTEYTDSCKSKLQL